MSVKFTVHSFSSKNISFRDGPDDTIQYSYCGRFNALGQDYNAISAEKLIYIAKGLERIQIFGYYKNPMSEKEERDNHLACYIKNLYVVRNVCALNNILNDKNLRLAKQIESSVNKNKFITLISLVLKICTLFHFDLRKYLCERQYNQKCWKPDPRSPFRRNGWIITKANNGIEASIFEEYMHGLSSDTSQILRVKKDDLGSLEKTAEKLIENPAGKFEDYFEFIGKLGEEYTIEGLYNLNLKDWDGHEAYLNGHLLDGHSEHVQEGHDYSNCQECCEMSFPAIRFGMIFPPVPGMTDSFAWVHNPR